ncbi:hypothetical protein TNCV_3053951 [Trichonephila clavipes]|nr:hypothetical protein TNCV_3053951 [Trichonephila clavipes]
MNAEMGAPEQGSIARWPTSSSEYSPERNRWHFTTQGLQKQTLQNLSPHPETLPVTAKCEEGSVRLSIKCDRLLLSRLLPFFDGWYLPRGGDILVGHRGGSLEGKNAPCAKFCSPIIAEGRHRVAQDTLLKTNISTDKKIEVNDTLD